MWSCRINTFGAGRARWARAALVIASGVSLAVPTGSFAQSTPSVSRTLPESVVPVRRGSDNSITLPQRSAARIPAGAEAISVTVDAAVFEGADCDVPPAAAAAHRRWRARALPDRAGLHRERGRLLAARAGAGLNDNCFIGGSCAIGAVRTLRRRVVWSPSITRPKSQRARPAARSTAPPASAVSSATTCSATMRIPGRPSP